MFTIEQIKSAHGKVKSGADFPAYIADLKVLGVLRYETFVNDGHTDYYGAVGQASLPANYDIKEIADTAKPEQFKTDLKNHQQGGSDYPTFCNQAAGNGIEKWAVDLAAMTCTYYDKSGNEVLREIIPG